MARFELLTEVTPTASPSMPQLEAHLVKRQRSWGDIDKLQLTIGADTVELWPLRKDALLEWARKIERLAEDLP